MSLSVKHAAQLIRRFGIGWVAYRASYALRMRLGLLERHAKPYAWADRPLSSWLKAGVPSDPAAYQQWRATHGGRFFFERLPDDLPPSPTLIKQAEAILAGRFPFFERLTFEVGFPPDWHVNPMSGSHIPADRHWSRISDFGAGDIKLVWETSRFGAAYRLLRAYARQADERYPAAFWTLVEDWAEHNPPQQGPQWKSGQELAFRLMAWCFGLYGFAESPQTTPTRVAQLTAMIAAHAERIEQDIEYARSQKNNHAISEALALWTVGLLFPEFQRAARWREQGRRILEAEVARQVYDDGAYVQHSMTYHRLMLHDCLWALRLGELNDQRLSEAFYDRVRRAADFLLQMIDPVSGQVPNYGSNDGALILPLNDCDFADFRPVLQASYGLLQQRRLFLAGPWDEDLAWLGLPPPPEVDPPLLADLHAKVGGYLTLRAAHSWMMLRCATLRDRPSQADQLHVDLWWRGINIAVDAGTYLYNGEPPWNNGLATTAVHNTVTVEGQDQMTRVGVFLWLDWAQGRVHSNQQSEHLRYLEVSHDGYQPVSYRRAVLQIDESWLVLDVLHAPREHPYRLHWLLPDVPYQLEGQRLTLDTAAGPYSIQCVASEAAEQDLLRADATSQRGWQARSYAQKTPALSWA
ncbi:MAG: hypothetical protein GYB68_12800, partial [Chloroflexi bacterium]|nr:hypothetical protein [Chloroflexota bacterium]